MNGLRVLLVVLCAFVLLGGVLIYCVDNDDYDVALSSSGDFTISGFMPAEYSYRVYTGSDVPEHLYIYLDSGYSSFFNYYKQKEFSEGLTLLLKNRGYGTVSYVDASQLPDVLSNADDSAVMFVSGSLPDTVTLDAVITYMENGGCVYWSGPDIGSYVSHKGSCDETDDGYFGEYVNDKDDEQVKAIADIGRSIGLSLDELTYGLGLDCPDSEVLSTYGEKHSSLSVVPVGEGRIFVFGTNLSEVSINVESAVAELIICGIGEDTEITSSGSGHKGIGDAKGSIEIGPDAELVIFSIGKPYSAWAKVFDL